MGPIADFDRSRRCREGLAFDEHMFRGYVQLVHEAFDCFDRGDWDRLRPLIAPDSVMTPPEMWPDPGPFIGPDESIREYKRLFEMFRGIEVTVGNIVSHEELVVAHYRGVMEVEMPDLPNELDFTGVHRFENDLFAESHYRLDRDAAFAAAGL
jgi:ketosteroid isomerase-like protein